MPYERLVEEGICDGICYKSKSQLSTPPSTSPLLNINLFQILEIPVTTTVSECKSAYKGLDGHYYPNKFKDFNFFSKTSKTLSVPVSCLSLVSVARPL